MGVGYAGQVRQRKEWGHDSAETEASSRGGWWLELMSDILTMFTPIMGFRINHRGQRTKTGTDYCSILAKRTGPGR